jgi:hypothetical protein
VWEGLILSPNVAGTLSSQLFVLHVKKNDVTLFIDEDMANDDEDEDVEYYIVSDEDSDASFQ